MKKHITEEQFKYISWKFISALKIERILSAMPKSKWYAENSEFFRYLEERNRLLNDAISEVNKVSDNNIPMLRIHKMDASSVFYAISDLLQEHTKEQRKIAK